MSALSNEQIDRLERVLNTANEEFAQKADELIRTILGVNNNALTEEVREIKNLLEEIRDSLGGM
jgi:hypothetical protein